MKSMKTNKYEWWLIYTLSYPEPFIILYNFSYSQRYAISSSKIATFKCLLRKLDIHCPAFSL